jgi:predicted transcriptional regulator
MDQAEFQKLLEFFKALANDSRLKIIGILANRACSVSDLADLLDLKEPTVSHHLGMLKELGLVTMRADGNTHIYSLDQDALVRMNKDLLSSDRIAALVENVDERGWEAKVRSNFIVDGKLTQIPAQFKKRMAILRWLADKFELDRRYPEKELNEVIKQYHPDCASLRRYMIETGLMQRENGVYWRLPAEAQHAERQSIA